MKFLSVNHAMRWAVETASRPNIKTTTPVKISHGYGGMERSDYLDLALTILSKINQLENKLQKDTLKCVYGGDKASLLSISNIYAKHHDMQAVLFYIALLDEYVHIWHGSMLSNGKAERIVGLKRGQLRKHKAKLDEAKLIISRTVQQAEAKLQDHISLVCEVK